MDNMAALEQALSTRVIEVRIYHTRQDPRCKDTLETNQHITAGCKMLAGKVAGIVSRNICSKFEVETLRSNWDAPPVVVEKDRGKVLWNFQIQTNKERRTRRLAC